MNPLSPWVTRNEQIKPKRAHEVADISFPYGEPGEAGTVTCACGDSMFVAFWGQHAPNLSVSRTSLPREYFAGANGVRSTRTWM